MSGRYCAVLSCVAMADEGDEYCSVHRTYCVECGFPKHRHPIVHVTVDGPRMVCGRGVGEQTKASA